MNEEEKTDRNRTGNEWNAVARQSKALKEIGEVVKSDEPAGDNLRAVVEDHSQACDEIKEKLAAHTKPQSTES
jgi:hypothetical protein